MYRATTPTHTYTLPIQTSTCKIIEVTYVQIEHKLTFLYEDETLPSGMTLDGKNVVIKLTQDQTKAFLPSYPAESQVRVLTEDGDVFDSQIFLLDVEKSLSERVLVDD